MTKWALLIGVDFYAKGSGKNSLKGCVCDVKMMKKHLEKHYTHLNIRMLSATSPSSPEPNHCTPVESSDLWPTWNNVFHALKRIISQAKEGEEFYLHYSGHGIRLPTESSIQDESLALALFENRKPPLKYFYGHVLAAALSQMVRKGLRVTVVLDCCFSGGVLRSDTAPGVNVRSLDYDPEVASASPQTDQNTFLSPADETRDGIMTSQTEWLTDPKGYTILAACGPRGTAYERDLGNGIWRGALSCFLTDALDDMRTKGVAITNESLYGHLRGQFHSLWMPQTPMCYGSNSPSFFGTAESAPGTKPWIPVSIEGDLVRLEAGLAHGVRKGDEYELRPANSPELAGSSADTERPIILQVGSLGNLSSELIEPGASTSSQLNWTLDIWSWKARQVGANAAGRITVRFQSSAHNHFFANGPRSLEQPNWLHIQAESDPSSCMYHVTVNSHSEYEILDGSLQAVENLPRVPLHTNRNIDSNAQDALIGILQHIAQFKYFEGIDNQLPDPAFESGFSISAQTSDGRPVASDGIHVKNGETWKLVAENRTDDTLFIVVFNMTPAWKIFNLGARGDVSSFIPLTPRRSRAFPTTMTVPGWLLNRGQTRCEDIIKVFVTSRPSQFGGFILDDMTRTFPGQLRSGNGEGNNDAISNFLRVLTAGGGLRHSGSYSQDGKWATRKLFVRTTLSLDEDMP